MQFQLSIDLSFLGYVIARVYVQFIRCALAQCDVFLMCSALAHVSVYAARAQLWSLRILFSLCLFPRGMAMPVCVGCQKLQKQVGKMWTKMSCLESDVQWHAKKVAEIQAVFATSVPMKGPKDDWTGKVLQECLYGHWGRTRIKLRSDGEPAICDLKKDVHNQRAH